MKHTDVLLIDQFLTSTGEMYSQDELGICKRQWVRLKKLAEMAQRAGLMPGDPINLAHYSIHFFIGLCDLSLLLIQVLVFHSYPIRFSCFVLVL